MSNDKPTQMELWLGGVGGNAPKSTVRRVVTLKSRLERLATLQHADHEQHMRDDRLYNAFKTYVAVTKKRDEYDKINGEFWRVEFVDGLIRRYEDFNYRTQQRIEMRRETEMEIVEAEAYLRANGIDTSKDAK